MSFYPDGASVPAELRTADLLLQPLTPEHVHLDYEAVMSSQEQLLRFSDGLWPEDGFPLSANLEDLQRHNEEHIEREAFTFTVLNHDASRCEGCVYISPWEHAVDHPQIDSTLADIDAGEYEAVVTFWIRSDRLDLDYERQLVTGLLDWFKRDWQFSRIFFMTNDQLPGQVEVLQDSGLKQTNSFGSPSGTTRWLFFA